MAGDKVFRLLIVVLHSIDSELHLLECNGECHS